MDRMFCELLEECSMEGLVKNTGFEAAWGFLMPEQCISQYKTHCGV